MLAGSLGYYLYFVRQSDALQGVIEEFGFFPVVPPNDSALVGSFYYVNLNGKGAQPVCSASLDKVRALMVSSNMSNQHANILREAKANFGADILDLVNAKLGDSVVSQIEYSFSDVYMHQMDGNSLFEIEKDLFESTNCDELVGEYIDNLGLVCQVQSAIMATVNYVAIRRDGTKIETSADARKISDGLQVDSFVATSGDGTSRIEGKALYYGMRFKPRCVTKPGESAVIFPDSFMERTLLTIRFAAKRFGW